MKKNLFHQSRLLLTLLSGVLLCVAASAVQAEPVPLTKTETELLNRFSASYRMMFNVSVSFKNLGGFTALTDPGPAAGGVENRRYDDGYNLVDNNNNSYGDLQATRNWGYDNASQVVDERYIVMHSSSSAPGVSSNDRSDNPQSGFELAYQLEIARTDTWRWGVEAAFGITWLSINDGRALAGDVTRINDSFEVPADEEGFRFIPPPGHRGSDAAGPLLGSEPTPPRNTSVLPGAASITGKRSFDADIFGFRLGPYADIPLNDRIVLTLAGGLALAYVNSDFTFDEAVTIADVGTQLHSGSGSHDDLLVGGYLAGSVAVALNKNKDWHFVAGAQFQDLGEYTHKENGKKAVLDLRAAVFVTVGVGYSF
jgi:hypothetical protein